MTEPHLRQFEGEYAGKVKVIRVNVRDPESAAYKEYMPLSSSSHVPHFILIDGNKNVLNQQTGALDFQGLVQFAVNELLLRGLRRQPLAGRVEECRGVYGLALDVDSPVKVRPGGDAGGADFPDDRSPPHRVLLPDGDG
jgi:hypothetical protein